MQRARWMIVSATLWLAGITAAQAVPMGLPAVWTDTFDPDDQQLTAGSAGNLLTFTLDIQKDGFRPGIDLIDDAALTLVLLDDFDFAKEFVSFNYDGTGWTSAAEVNFFSAFFFDPIDLLSDGLLTVSLKSTRGDFLFDNAFLTAFGEKGAAVPEPGTIALLGLGLLGIGVFGTRQFGTAKFRIKRLARRRADHANS